MGEDSLWQYGWYDIPADAGMSQMLAVAATMPSVIDTPPGRYSRAIGRCRSNDWGYSAVLIEAD